MRRASKTELPSRRGVAVDGKVVPTGDWPRGDASAAIRATGVVWPASSERVDRDDPILRNRCGGGKAELRVDHEQPAADTLGRRERAAGRRREHLLDGGAREAVA